MIRIAALILALSVGTAQAEFALSGMTGTWAGNGTYTEGMSQARMRCRLTITGTDAKVTMSGRCGSSLGAEDVAIDLTRQADGRITVSTPPGSPQQDSAIKTVSGRPDGTQLFLTGAGGKESVAMQFVQQPDGTLYFATERKWATGSSRSRITLSKR